MGEIYDQWIYQIVSEVSTKVYEQTGLMLKWWHDLDKEKDVSVTLNKMCGLDPSSVVPEPQASITNNELVDLAATVRENEFQWAPSLSNDKSLLDDEFIKCPN
jgi:hypothetical protein